MHGHFKAVDVAAWLSTALSSFLSLTRVSYLSNNLFIYQSIYLCDTYVYSYLKYIRRLYRSTTLLGRTSGLHASFFWKEAYSDRMPALSWGESSWASTCSLETIFRVLDGVVATMDMSVDPLLSVPVRWLLL